jgi:hypothetical protein
MDESKSQIRNPKYQIGPVLLVIVLALAPAAAGQNA